ncbi:MAG: DUF262 domain-containing protein [Acidobacteria bacterium]|nr:DUF262 domain-containing protein [Acidobacteriota bacterium]
MPDGNQKRTEVVPEVVFLGKLVERVAAGKIRVPRFQRAFVWKQPDLGTLLDSVLRGFPIGSILVWDTEESIESTPRIGPLKVRLRADGPAGYLLDGQQRVSTLAGTLLLTDEMDPLVDQIDWRLYYDLDKPALDKPAFIDHRKLADDPGPRYFPVRSLLSTAGFFAACRRIQEQVDEEHRARRWLDEADHLASAFRNYQLPLIHIREADLESAVTVFARLNRTGRKMAADELVSALTYEGDFHLASMLNEFKAELKKKGFGSLDRVFLLRSVLAALERDIYAKDWADLMVKPEVRERLPEAFDVATQGIRLALEMLEGLGVSSDRLLPYGLQLVLLGEFYRICPQPAAGTVELLTRWFWVTSFTGWFGGVNTAQAKRALEEIRHLARGESETFEIVDLDMPAQPFPDRFDGRSARVRAFLLYLASLRPRSLRGDGNLDPGALLSRLGTDAVGYVVSNPDPRDLVSSPANRMFVDARHVGQAVGALADLDDDVLGRVLPTHGFPIECIGRLRNGNRAVLIEERLATLISGERDFMARSGVRTPAERTAPAIADSEASDDE